MTPEQMRAATTLDRNVVVTAGPGSGKTRVLVERYLSILESGQADIENIVAITFTKKAALEMRERIRKKMVERAAESTDPEVKAVWRRRRRKLETAVISTIHAFCTKLLKDHPIEAGIDPQFATLDTYQESVMTNFAAQSAVASAIDGGSSLAAELVASYTRTGLVNSIERVHKRARGIGVAIDDIVDRTLQGLATEEDFIAAIDEVDELVDDALVTLASFPDRTAQQSRDKQTAAGKLLPFSDYWKANVGAIRDPSTLPEGVSRVHLLTELSKKVPTKTIKKQLVPYVTDLAGRCGADSDESGLLGLALDLESRAVLPVFAGLVANMDRIYTDEKRAVSALDFEDLQIQARRLLSEFPDVASRARRKYTHFLVDEFQDTNGLQRDILRTFVEGKGAANLFVVGDPKQSIYGFRGAEVSVFAETERQVVSDGGEMVPLSTNFRSDSRLVDFVRSFFDRLMAVPGCVEHADLESLGYVANGEVKAERIADSTEPVVDLILHTTWGGGGEPEIDPKMNSGDDEGMDGRDREAQLLAGRLREIVTSGEPFVRTKEGLRPCRYGDMALLLRAKTHVKAYERALRKAGIPFYVVAGKGFYDRPETRDLLEVLRFLDNTTDEIALASVLRSPLFGVSDDSLVALRADRLAAMRSTGRRPRSGGDQSLWEAVRDGRGASLQADDQRIALGRASEVLGALGEVRNRLPIADLLREIIRLTQIDAVVAAAEDGAQRLSNIDKLVAVARAFGRGSGRLLGDFTEFVREFKRLDSDEAEADVRTDSDSLVVMTVHQSKGLEYPVIAIADMGSPFRNQSDRVLLDRAAGLGFKVPDGAARTLPSRLHRRIVARARTRDRFEAMRTLFVAMTRAEDRLVLSASTVAKLTADGVPEVDSKKEFATDRSWLEWLLRAVAECGGHFDREAGELIFGTARARLIGGSADTDGEPVPVVGDEAPAGEIAAIETDDAAPDTDEVVARVTLQMQPLPPTPAQAVSRYGVTSLMGFRSCPRRFLYARVLRVPELADQERVRDLSERAERGTVVPASLRGLVVHRFCETLRPGEAEAERLLESVGDVRRDRGDAYPDVFGMLSDHQVAEEVESLAANYARSRRREHIDTLSRAQPTRLQGLAESSGGPGFVVSEMGFSLWFEDAALVGVVDKLLLEPDGSDGWIATVIDFKTNRIDGAAGRDASLSGLGTMYRLQMQSYALAVARLIPRISRVQATLVALAGGPDVEVSIEPEHLEIDVVERTIRAVLGEIRGGGDDPGNFPARPSRQCSTCAHLTICPEGFEAFG